MIPQPKTGSPPLFSYPPAPDFALEEGWRVINPNHCGLIAGVDEAGRGPLAGPVVAAAVVLDQAEFPAGLNDSKKLSAAKREALMAQLLQCALVAWVAIPAWRIDQINIRQATLIAMDGAVAALPQYAAHILVDGRDLPCDIAYRSRAVIGGDAKSLSIAAASIVAKTVRDQMMAMADRQWPHYGFAAHKGYGTKFHRQALVAHGPCPLHRHSFRPVAQGVRRKAVERTISIS